MASSLSIAGIQVAQDETTDITAWIISSWGNTRDLFHVVTHEAEN